MTTNVITILYDSTNNFIRVENKSANVFKKINYSSFNHDNSLFILCTNQKSAKNIKTSIETILSNDLIVSNDVLYKIDSYYKAIEMVDLLKKHIGSIRVYKYHELEDTMVNIGEYYDLSLNFFSVYNSICNEIDKLIINGALLKKSSKNELYTIIFNNNLDILNHVQLDWIYNKDENIIIDYSGLIKWKALGVYPNHRKLVEMKYFI